MMQTRYAKLNSGMFVKRGDPDSWIEIDSSFKGQIIAEDKEYVVLSDGNVRVRVKKYDVTEVQ